MKLPELQPKARKSPAGLAPGWSSFPRAIAAVITHPTDMMALFIPPLAHSPQSGHKLTSWGPLAAGDGSPGHVAG